MADIPINFTGKVRGWNLTSKPGHPLESAYWVEWDWTGWIRRQIDYAMSLGANCIRLIGDVAMVQNALITQNTYNTQLQQLVKYCIDNGLAYYYCGCALWGTDGVDNGTTALTDAQIASIISASIGSITGVSGAPDYRASIIGCEIVSEPNVLTLPHLSTARVNNIYSLVKPNVPSTIGCTFGATDTVQSTTWVNAVLASLDYLDYHIYPQNYTISTQPTPTDITNGPRTNWPTKDVFFGEGGLDTSVYTGAQARSWIDGLMTLYNMSDSHVRGGLTWAVQDQTSTQNYGAFDGTWAARSDVAARWIRGLGSGSLLPPTKLRVLNNRLVWDPTNCSSTWDSTKLYRDGSQIANPVTCIYDDSANWSAQHRYQVSAVAGASESAKSAVFYYPGGFGWLRTG